ncbi:hypothetical protein BH24BAC1_BH24BAC1_31110 [soil metagenome]
MDKAYLAILIQKVKAGTATPAEKAELEAFWRQALEEETYPQSLTPDEQEAIRLSMLSKIQGQILRAERQGRERHLPQKTGALIPMRQGYLQAAALIVLLLTVGVVLFNTFYLNRVTTERTAFGERREITLPDQSVVMLNGNSSVRYASGWGDSQTREVWLDGEAFFEVRHTASHQKFVVHTPGELRVEVLGTKFNVNNWQGKTEVVLQEGKVKVADTRQEYVMEPGEMVSYSPATPKLVSQKVNPTVHLSWKNNVLIFNSEPIGAIMDRLAQSHGLRVEFREESLREELFTGSVPGDSVELLLEKIGEIYPVRVRQEEGLYIIE